MKKGAEQITGQWLSYVDLFAEAFRRGLERPAEDGFNPALDKTSASPKGSQQRSIALCSPHPDDECLTGTLPLRLLQENKARVFNLAATLGSAPTRKRQRLEELEAACALLGFDNRIVGGGLGLDNLNAEARKASPKAWRQKVDNLVEEFTQILPALVFMPHRQDGHPSHEGAHLLVTDALTVYTREAKSDVYAVTTEFWQPHRQPNLLVGVDRHDLALLVAALTRHKGEISRNPYHLWLPARMMDNLRRGWELVRGSLEKAPDFCFAELYHASVYSQGVEKTWDKGNKVFSPQDKIDCFRFKTKAEG